jgi:hypothetical protein
MTTRGEHPVVREREETTMTRIGEATAVLPDEITREDQPAPVPAWAERLAQRVRHAHDPAPQSGPHPEEWLPAATALLGAQCDAAVGEANAALERSGLSELCWPAFHIEGT